MDENDLDNYEMPWLGREIARFFVNIARAVRASLPKRDGRATLRVLRLFNWLKRHYIWVLISIAVFAFGELWFDLIAQLRDNLFQAAKTSGEALETEAKPEYLRAVAILIATTAAALVAIATAPFALLKAWVNERTATTAEQGHITDRMTKAIEQLGAEKTVYKADSDGKPITEPNLEVRIGAIFALERIAQDSERDHIPIMETLSAYIRKNAGFAPTNDPSSLKIADYGKSGSEQIGKIMKWVDELPSVHTPRADVGAAFAVINNRSLIRRLHERSRTKRFGIDLSQANLQRMALLELDLSAVVMFVTRADGAILGQVQFDNADLSYAFFNCAKFRRASFRHANLTGTQFVAAGLRGADFSFAEFRNCECAGANFRGANLSTAMNLTQDQVNSGFGDNATVLPHHIQRPTHWAESTLEPLWADDPEYNDWIARGAPPGKPVED